MASITTDAPLPPKMVLVTLLATMIPSPGWVTCPKEPPLKDRKPEMSNRVPVATN